jgi:long-chain acyl-CoA synthetase
MGASLRRFKRGGCLLEVQNNIVQMVRAACAQFDDLPAYTCLGASLSFHELDRLSDNFAAWLVHAVQLPPGARVAIQLPNLMQYPVVALGVFKAQGVVVNLNPLYTAKEVLPLLQDSGALVLVVLANVAHHIAEIVAQTPLKAVVVSEVGDMLGTWRGAAANFVMRYVKRRIKPYRLLHSHSLKSALTRGVALRASALPTQDFACEQLAVLQYTGGTTGIPKAAMLSHRNLLANMQQLETCLAEDCPQQGDRMLSPLPLYHIYGFSLCMLMAVHRGCHILLIPNPSDTNALVELLRKVKINGFIGINTLYKNLLEHPAISKVDFSQLKISTSGGMALAEKIAADWQRLTGVRVLEGYGLTECSPTVAANSYHYYKIGTVGKPAPETELLLLALNGERAAIGEPGEICVKGPQVMQGYWQNPTETARTIDAAGWLHTGDIGVLDADGYLKVVDRIKDMIIVSGFNVFPQEIENHLCTHPDVTDACAVNVGDEMSPLIKVFVVCRQRELSADAIVAHCRKGLAPYKVPKLVEFRASLPKSTVGKVLRRELREEAIAGGAVNAH